MCWSLESSAYMGTFGIIVGLYVTVRNASVRDRWAGPFLATFSLMQLVDAVFWWDEAHFGLENHSLVNYCTTRFAVGTVLHLETVVMFFCTRYSAPHLVKSRVLRWLYVVYNAVCMGGRLFVLYPYSRLSAERHIQCVPHRDEPEFCLTF